MVPSSLQQLLSCHRTLLLQGPMGPFFTRLADTLRQQGQQVWKVNFNGGDEHFFPPGERVIRFDRPLPEWPSRLRGLLSDLAIDAIVLFGQSRHMHEVAMAVGTELGLRVFVFEEGYMRPDYVTLEVGGVNAESGLPRQTEFYAALTPEPQSAPRPTGQSFRGVADLAMRYGWEMWRARRHFPHYEHHRCLHPVREGSRWLRGGWRKWHNRWAERHMQDFLSAPEQHKRYFLVPLQVHNDAQVTRHSRFATVAEFIVEVMASFARHAPQDKLLVFKHHPLDRPYNDYRQLIAEQAQRLGLASRVHYIHDQHLPTLLQHARGVVTINSTTGLQSLYHGTPVVTLGDCFYAVKGMVHAGPLAAFWRQPGRVDRALFRKFREHVIRATQLNASFYAEAPGLPAAAAALSTGDRRRRALASSTPSAVDQAASWSSPTAPTLK